MRALVAFVQTIKLTHTIFALPFALASAWLAAAHTTVTWLQVLLILGCMVTARSAAMGFNRIVDRRIDAANPRTAMREIPSGKLTVGAAWGFTVASAVAFVLLSVALGPLTAALSPIALAVILGYSLTKRFTALCHLVLGLALALAPIAVWVALLGRIDATPLLLALAVGTWVAGFDIIYATQDVAFDRSNGLRSIPAVLGVGPALAVSAVLHVGTVGALSAVWLTEALSWPYWVGMGVITAVLAYEHWIVRPSDLSRVNKAFFDLNGLVSLVFLAFVFLA